MKGLVMEVHENRLVVLTDDGAFIEVPGGKDPVAIGDRVDCPAPTPQWVFPPMFRRMAAVAASLAVAFAGLGVYGYTQPFGTAMVEVNPKVLLTYNWFEQVLKAEGLNAEGELLVRSMEDYRHEPLNQVIETVAKQAVAGGYFKDPAAVLYVAVADNRSEAVRDRILSEISLEILPIPKSDHAVYLKGNPSDLHKALSEGKSPVVELVREALEHPEEAIVVNGRKPLRELEAEKGPDRIDKQEHPEGTSESEEGPPRKTDPKMKPEKKEKPQKDPHPGKTSESLPPTLTEPFEEGAEDPTEESTEASETPSGKSEEDRGNPDKPEGNRDEDGGKDHNRQNN